MAKDSPGVHLPPPLIYVAAFFLSIWLQHLIPLPQHLAHPRAQQLLGVMFCVVALVFILPALLTFLRSRNTLITFLPSSSLQTGGVYSWSRNPMYLGLLLAYIGLALLKGNWWTLFLVPVLVGSVERLVIKKEEDYLGRAYGAAYEAYRGRVRRWFGRKRNAV